MTIVRVVVYNVKNAGWNPATRFHDNSILLDALDQVPVPHVLALPECTNLTLFHKAPLWELVRQLNELLPGNEVYYPFLSERPEGWNHPGLFVASGMVEPIAPYLLGDPGGTRGVLANTLHCRVAGLEAWLQAVHWDGSGGPGWFDFQSARSGELGAKPTLLAGDFNCGSTAEQHLMPSAVQWLRRNLRSPWKLRQKARRKHGLWTPQTEPYDDLLEAGFWDAAQVAGDTTPTVNRNVDGGSYMLIDRIAASHKLPARLVKGSYRVLIPPAGQERSDHRLVYCEFEFGEQFAGTYETPLLAA